MKQDSNDKTSSGPYLRRPEAAEYLSVSLRQLDEWKATGEIPFIYLGKRLVSFAMPDLDAFMMKNRISAGE